MDLQSRFSLSSVNLPLGSLEWRKKVSFFYFWCKDKISEWEAWVGLQPAIVNGQNYTAVNNSEPRDSLKESYAAVDLLHWKSSKNSVLYLLVVGVWLGVTSCLRSCVTDWQEVVAFCRTSISPDEHGVYNLPVYLFTFLVTWHVSPCTPVHNTYKCL